MKKILLAFIVLYFASNLTLSVFAQQNSERCGFNQLIESQELKTPGYKAQVDAYYQALVERANQKKTVNNKTIYTIPVVFHVVWNSSDPNQNLDDSVLIEQIAVLNEDYSRTNADTVNTRSGFLPIVGDAQIQFQLACRDTNGNPTNGIVRVQTTATFGGGWIPNMADIGKIQRTAQGGSDPWRPSEYLNIWVGDINGGGTPSLLGIATPPDGLPNWPTNSVPPELHDGAIIQWNAFGRNNPNPINGYVVNGRTVTHEVGHYLGVRHTAENTFGGLFGSICGDDDGLTDTPTCDQSAQGCDFGRNSCVDAIPGTVGDLPDMVENYMDYSDQDCQNSFTVGQTLIMQDVIQNWRTGLINSPGIANCTTSVEEAAAQEEYLGIYPNPSTGIVNINLRDKFSYTVYNSLGQLITPTIISDKQFSIQQSGVYFIKIKTTEQTYTERIIVQ